MNIVPASSYLVEFSHESILDKPENAPAQIQVEKATPQVAEVLSELELTENLLIDESERDENPKSKVANDEVRKVEIAEALARQENRLKAEHQAELEKLNATFSDQLAQNFTRQFEQCLNQVESEISQAVLTIIEPFLDASVRERAMSDLVKIVEGIKHDLKSTTVTLRGHEHEIEQLRTSLERIGLQANCIVTEAQEVALEIDDMWIETRFVGWKKAFYQLPESQVIS